jgi:hypothetical protein
LDKPCPDSKSKSKGKKPGAAKAASAKAKLMRDKLQEQKKDIKEKDANIKALEKKFDRWMARNPTSMLSTDYKQKAGTITEKELTDMMAAWAVQTRDTGSLQKPRA